MKKKYFETPYVKVVEVKNDIIATSFDTLNQASSDDLENGYDSDDAKWNQF